MSPASIVTRTQRLRTTHQNLGFFYSVLLLEHHFSLHRCFLVKHFLEAPRVHRHFCAISTCCHGEGKILGKYWKWIWVIREVGEVLGRYVREIKGTISLVVWCWKLCKFCTRTKPKWNPGLLHLHLQWCQSWFFVPFRKDNTVEPGCSFPSESTTFLLGNFKEKKVLKMQTQPICFSKVCINSWTPCWYDPSSLTGLLFFQNSLICKELQGGQVFFQI